MLGNIRKNIRALKEQLKIVRILFVQLNTLKKIKSDNYKLKCVHYSNALIAFKELCNNKIEDVWKISPYSLLDIHNDLLDKQSDLLVLDSEENKQLDKIVVLDSEKVEQLDKIIVLDSEEVEQLDKIIEESTTKLTYLNEITLTSREFELLKI